MLKRLVEGAGFEIHFSLTGGVLRAQIEGLHDSFEISLAYWKEISEERRRCGAQRLLVIENLVEDGRPDELLELFENLVGLGFEGCKVAFVDNGNEERSMHEYVAILAREHGILAAVFSEESAATIWLRHGEE
ncbi:hypothetical protein OS187_01835 [Xanthomonadaceae bacterium JHOS43]|nr:hypothetical protein [Xanthomonadaceae bacterium JHOS43]